MSSFYTRKLDPRNAQKAAAIALLAAVAGLAACALDTAGYVSGEDPGIDVMLMPVSVIGDAGSLNQGGIGRQLGFASAVAARAGQVFVVDSMAGELVQVDVFGNGVRLVKELADANTSGLYVTQDLTIYLVDRQSRSVVEIDDRGWERQRFADRRLIPAPVDVTAINWGSTLIIADELSRRLVLFDNLANPAGMLNSTLSPVISAASVGAIAASNGSVFVLDTASREAEQFDLQGRLVATYGEDALLAPVAITADSCGRVFVADGHADGLFVTSYEHQGSGARAALPGQIRGAVTDLWIDGSELYVAAGPFGVHVLAIQPACMGR